MLCSRYDKTTVMLCYGSVTEEWGISSLIILLQTSMSIPEVRPYLAQVIMY